MVLKCSLEHTFATVRFKCTHKFTCLLPIPIPIPTCIDHILTNQNSLFKFSKTFETGLSEHYKLISTTMKSSSFKGPPKKKRFTDVIKTLTLQISATL